MKTSEVYLKAAELIDVGYTRCSCDAVTNAVCGGQRFGASAEATAYAELFCPCEWPSSIWGDCWSDHESERKDCRVLALLFMHQIAKDAERSK